jgi:hypothetical protein
MGISSLLGMVNDFVVIVLQLCYDACSSSACEMVVFWNEQVDALQTHPRLNMFNDRDFGVKKAHSRTKASYSFKLVSDRNHRR